MSKLLRWVRALVFRKPTTPVHIAGGIVVALALASNLWLLGLCLFIGFAWFEYWECRLTGDTGHVDYWELLLGMFIAAAVLLLW